MKIQTIVAGDFGTDAYIVYDYDGNRCILVDAPFPYDKAIGFIASEGLHPEALLLTHGHFDHIFGIPALLAAFPETEICIDENDMHFLENGAEESLSMASAMSPMMADRIASCAPLMPDGLVAYKERYSMFDIIRTPGHTSGSVCIYSEKEKILFSGDTLFMYGVGRTDLGGNSTELSASLKKLMALPGDTVVLPGHGMSTSIERERKGNPFL